MNFSLKIADESDTAYAETISEMYAQSSKARGTGIAVRKPEYIAEKMQNGNAIIAFVEGFKSDKVLSLIHISEPTRPY